MGKETQVQLQGNIVQQRCRGECASMGVSLSLCVCVSVSKTKWKKKEKRKKGDVAATALANGWK